MSQSRIIHDSVIFHNVSLFGRPSPATYLIISLYLEFYVASANSLKNGFERQYLEVFFSDLFRFLK